MAEYKPKNSGILSVNDVKEGDKVVLAEAAYEKFSEANQKSYWNCKVILPNGTTKLAGLMDRTCDAFATKWGTNTDGWAGRSAIVNLKTSKAGNLYINLVPTDEPAVKVDESMASNQPETPKDAEESINPEDIPF